MSAVSAELKHPSGEQPSMHDANGSKAVVCATGPGGQAARRVLVAAGPRLAACRRGTQRLAGPAGGCRGGRPHGTPVPAAGLDVLQRPAPAPAPLTPAAARSSGLRSPWRRASRQAGPRILWIAIVRLGFGELALPTRASAMDRSGQPRGPCPHPDEVVLRAASPGSAERSDIRPCQLSRSLMAGAMLVGNRRGLACDHGEPPGVGWPGSPAAWRGIGRLLSLAWPCCGAGMTGECWHDRA